MAPKPTAKISLAMRDPKARKGKDDYANYGSLPITVRSRPSVGINTAVQRSHVISGQPHGQYGQVTDFVKMPLKSRKRGPYIPDAGRKLRANSVRSTFVIDPMQRSLLNIALHEATPRGIDSFEPSVLPSQSVVERPDPTVLLRKASEAQTITLENTLLAEYHILADLELQNALTRTQRERLQTVSWLLDNLDAQSQGVVVMDQRIRETQDQLNAILNAVEQLPNRVAK